MQELLDKIQNVKASTVKNRINTRLAEFSEIKNQDISLIFKELCFCIMTANCSAAKCIEVHEHIGDAFLSFSEIQLAKKLKELFFFDFF